MMSISCKNVLNYFTTFPTWGGPQKMSYTIILLFKENINPVTVTV